MWRWSLPVKKLIWLVGLAGVVAFWFYLSWHIPLNDDEVIQYQPIFCLMHPNASLSIFAERCDFLELYFFGKLLPLRSYAYLGSASALFFFPLWWTLQSPYAVRIWVGLLWLLHGYLLTRITRIPWAVSVSAAMFATPMLAQHMVDTGPTALQFVMIQVLVLLCLRALRVEAFWKTITCGIVAGLCSFVVIEQKAFAVNGVAYAIYLLATGYGVRKWNNSFTSRLGRFFSFSVFTLAVFFPLVHELLYAPGRYGGRYIDVMLGAAHNFSWQELDKWRAHAQRLYESFGLLPAAYFHRNYPIVLLPDYWLNYLLSPSVVLAWVAAGCLALLLLTRQWKNAGNLLLCGFLTLVAVALVSRSSGAWAGHHTIFAHIIPIIGVAAALGSLTERFKWPVTACICLMLYINIRPAWVVAHSRPADFSDPSRDQLLTIVNEEAFARNHLLLHLSWGSYFIDSLFGPKSQALIRHKEISDAVWKLAAESNRRLAVLKIHQPGWDKDSQAKGLHLAAAPAGGTWELWVQD